MTVDYVIELCKQWETFIFDMRCQRKFRELLGMILFYEIVITNTNKIMFSIGQIIEGLNFDAKSVENVI